MLEKIETDALAQDAELRRQRLRMEKELEANFYRQASTPTNHFSNSDGSLTGPTRERNSAPRTKKSGGVTFGSRPTVLHSSDRDIHGNGFGFGSSAQHRSTTSSSDQEKPLYGKYTNTNAEDPSLKVLPLTSDEKRSQQLQSDIQQHLLQRGSIGLRESKLMQKQQKVGANAGRVKNKVETKPEHFTLSNDKLIVEFYDALFEENAMKFNKFNSKPSLISALNLNMLMNGDTPLTWVIKQHSSPEIAIALVTNFSVDVCVCDIKKRTPLFLACERNWMPLVQAIGKKRGQKNRYSETAGQDTGLHVSIVLHYTEVMNYLLANKMVDPNHPGVDLWTPLHLACNTNQGRIVQDLVQQYGVKVNCRTCLQETPLLIAARQKNTEICLFLLEHGASAGLANDKGWPCVFEFVKTYPESKESLKEAIVRNPELLGAFYLEDLQYSMMHFAVSMGSVPLIMLLLDLGDVPDRTNSFGIAPLHVACKHGYLDCILTLLSRGADINVKSQLGETPLSIALNFAAGGSKDGEAIVKMLIDREANVLAVKDNRELLLSQSNKIQEMILATADGIDTPFIKFIPRPNLTVTPKIRAATVEQLILRATYERYPDLQFVKEFLLTYRLFMSPGVLLQYLIERWNVKPPPKMKHAQYMEWKASKGTPIRLRIVAVIKTWLDEHSLDFVESPIELKNIKQIIPHITKFHERSGSIIQASMDRLEDRWDDLEKAFYAKPPSLIKSSKREKRLNSFAPEKIAACICMMETAIFSKLTSREFLLGGWSNKDPAVQMRDSPTISTMINVATSMNYWIVNEILLHSDVSQRAKCITNAIKLCQALLLKGNFNALMAVVSGIQHNAIFRLKKTWALIRPEVMQVWKEMELLVSPVDNSINLRKMVKDTKPPKIPFLGLYLKDINAIHEIPSTVVEEGITLINFHKMRLISETILGLLMYTKQPYQMKVDQEITDYITKYPAIEDDEQLFVMSRQLEPPK